MAQGSHTCEILRGQEEPGGIIRVKLATGSCPEQSPVIAHLISKIKGFNNQWNLKKSPNLTFGGA